jgi:hypothetical protein
LFKLVADKVLPGVVGNQVWWSQISVNPVCAQDILCVLNTDVLQPPTCLEAGTFVDDVQQRGSANIHNVNNNIIIKINVVL